MKEENLEMELTEQQKEFIRKFCEAQAETDSSFQIVPEMGERDLEKVESEPEKVEKESETAEKDLNTKVEGERLSNFPPENFDFSDFRAQRSRIDFFWLVIRSTVLAFLLASFFVFGVQVGWLCCRAVVTASLAGVTEVENPFDRAVQQSILIPEETEDE